MNYDCKKWYNLHHVQWVFLEISFLCLFCFFFLLLLGCSTLPIAASGLTGDPFKAFPEKYRDQAIEHESEGELSKALFSWQIVRSFTPSDKEASERITALEEQIRIEADKHFQKGLHYLHKNSNQAARKEFLTALTYDPDHEQALDYLKHKLTEPDYLVYDTKEGDSFRKIAEKIYDDSEKDFLVAYFTNPDKGDAFGPGKKLMLPIIASALTAKPAYPEEMINEAKALFKSQEYEKAISLAEDILEYDPTDEEANDLMNASNYQSGMILLRQKKFEESLRKFTRVDTSYKNVEGIVSYIRKHLRNKAEIHYNNGVEHFLAEELDKAIKEWKETLRLDPEHPKAKRDLQKARRLLENLRMRQ